MAHIFDVVNGKRILIGIEHVVSSVDEVKNKISIASRIPVSRQILLLNGGEVLQGCDRISDFGCGTEENPVFLFVLQNETTDSSDPTNRSSHQIQSKVEYSDQCHQIAKDGFDGSLLFEIESENDCLPMKRFSKQDVQLVKDVTYSLEWLENCYYFVERVDSDILKLFKLASKCLSEQRMQIQGWLAGVANLEEYCRSFIKAQNDLQSMITEFKEIDMSFLFESRLTQKINELRLYCVPNSPSDHSDTSIVNSNECSLYTWINQKLALSGHDNNRMGLDFIVEESQFALSKVDITNAESLLNAMMAYMCVLKIGADNRESCDNRHLIGIEDRFLCLQECLDKLGAITFNSTSYLMAVKSSWKSIKSDARLKRERRFLSDVCHVYSPTFDRMIAMFDESAELCHRVTNAKCELSRTLLARVRWLIKIETDLAQLESKAKIYENQLRNAVCRVKVLEQISSIPDVYQKISEEISKRKEFESTYSLIRTRLIPSLTRYLRSEQKRRDSFSEQYGDHFLSTLVCPRLSSSYQDLECSLQVEDDGDVSICAPLEDDLNEYANRLNSEESLAVASASNESVCADASTDADELLTIGDIMDRICLTDNLDEEQTFSTYGNESCLQTSEINPIPNAKKAKIKVRDIVCIDIRGLANVNCSNTQPDGIDSNSQSKLYNTCRIMVYSSTPFFLHRQSIMNLKLTADNLLDGYAFGKVTKVQCCVVKKIPNRFNLPVNSKFYMVSCNAADSTNTAEDHPETTDHIEP